MQGRTLAKFAPAVLALLHLQMADSAKPETLLVPDDYATINSALWAAQPGDTVLLACGTYYEVGLYLYEKSDIILRSAGRNPECVTIDGQSAGTTILLCIRLTGNSRIEGITFANGGGENYAHPEEAGGLYIEDSSVVFDDCAFVENESGRGGGALNCLGSSVELDQCSLLANRADWNSESHASGGAILAFDCNISMDRCRFEANRSVGEGGGAAFSASQSTLTAHECEFIDNYNSTGGGNGALFLNDACTASLTSPWFEGNWAFAGLGSIVVGTNCALTVDGGVFVENHGGLSAEPDRPDEIGVADSGSAMISNSTFVAHLSSHHHPLFFVDQPGGELTLTNCLVVLGPNDVIGNCASGEVGFDCSDVYAVNGTAWIDCYADQLGVNGNISADPQFCGEPGSGNYYLQSDSPCAPANNSCGELIGALPVGCEAVATKASSISAIKSLY